LGEPIVMAATTVIVALVKNARSLDVTRTTGFATDAVS